MPNHLILDVSEKSLRPGDTVKGEFLWEFDRSPTALYLSLGWWTSGRGDRDEFVIESKEFSNPGAIGKESFSFNIPAKAVPSFSGSLISVEWGLQLSAKGVRIDDLIETLTVSPTREEIDISGERYESKGESLSNRKSRRVSVSNRS